MNQYLNPSTFHKIPKGEHLKLVHFAFKPIKLEDQSLLKRLEQYRKIAQAAMKEGWD